MQYKQPLSYCDVRWLELSVVHKIPELFGGGRNSLRVVKLLCVTARGTSATLNLCQTPRTTVSILLLFTLIRNKCAWMAVTAEFVDELDWKHLLVFKMRTTDVLLKDG